MMSSSLVNGTVNHKTGGGGGGGVGNRETYQLLNLTESDSEDGGAALTRLEAGEGGARKPENVPDLNLVLPNDQPGRGRRKIRLKRQVVKIRNVHHETILQLSSSYSNLLLFRRQHDNRRGLNSGQDSAVGADDYDWYLIPTCTARSVILSSGVASAVVAIVALIYFNVQINARLSGLTIDLDNGKFNQRRRLCEIRLFPAE